MVELNYLAIAVAAVAAFVVSTAWYIAFDSQRTRLLGVTPDPGTEAARPPFWKVATEIARSLVVAAVLAGFCVLLGIDDWTGALLLGCTVWAGFPAMILAGSVVWDDVPWQLAAIHVGDWFVKLVVIALIVGVWH